MCLRKTTLTFILGISYLVGFGQTSVELSQEVRELYQNAKSYLQKGDYANSIMVYNQAVNMAPESLLLRRELAFAYYIQGDLLKAELMILPLIKSEDADEETFKLAGKILSTKKKMSEAEEAINKGLKKFPNSGMLYEEKGHLYTMEKKYKSASKAWESGIEKDPTYHLNYYNLAKVYSFTKNYLWAILYGETFVNMESFSAKSQETKKIVFESYKYLMAELNNQALDGKVGKYDNPKDFTSACLSVFDGLRNVVTGGINTENLTMLRTRFLLEWNKKYALQYPFELIDYQQRLLSNNMFDTYNQWLFGNNDNSVAYKNWTQKFSTQMNQFDSQIRNNKLIPKRNQYYNNIN